MTKKKIEQRLYETEQRLKQLKELAKRQRLRESAIARKRERQEDDNRKFRIGGLAVLAGIDREDTGFLLGSMLETAARRDDQIYYARCKRQGDELLQRQAAVNRHSAAAQAQEASAMAKVAAPVEPTLAQAPDQEQE